MEIEKLMRHHSAAKKRIKFGLTMFIGDYFTFSFQIIRVEPADTHYILVH